ncbi:mitochondrial import inner membrane translocase subunit Tim10B [Galendromus occidentalis]|uniref:Mitochondrial import inner membrane translocase subunit n=1 Tax=Galendromus occidentalis TaxID=34638 RepID=A0AAJ6QT20_9ACAR|nr:mitochondrial import inner membrane translocase subunit Tim10B [Galendromus occidentalis]
MHKSSSVMDTESALRNFRDFLTIYNKMSEQCFAHCVNDLGQRQLTESEEVCVDKCVNKNIKLNHRMMEIYMKLQPEINQKRLQEQEALQQGVMQLKNDI